MKPLALFLGGALLVGPAPAIEREGRTLTLTDAEMEMCANGGECILVTEESLKAALHAARMKALLSCKGAT